MADKRTLRTLAALLAVAVVYFLATRPYTPEVNIDAASLEEHSYDPFIHWRIHNSGDFWYRPYPRIVAQNCLPDVVQNRSIGRAVEVIENASSSQ